MDSKIWIKKVSPAQYNASDSCPIFIVMTFLLLLVV